MEFSIVISHKKNIYYKYKMPCDRYKKKYEEQLEINEKLIIQFKKLKLENLQMKKILLELSENQKKIIEVLKN
jgi:hypothetical protein|tara:strand:+ start:2378 stop:2596 length:219 start_codon:yes stop_codon:yes gene_type:complete